MARPSNRRDAKHCLAGFHCDIQGTLTYSPHRGAEDARQDIQAALIKQNKGQASLLALEMWLEKPSAPKKQRWVSGASLVTVPVFGDEPPIAEPDDS